MSLYINKLDNISMTKKATKHLVASFVNYLYMYTRNYILEQTSHY